MKKVNHEWFKGPGPITIYSRGAAELISERFRRVIVGVMPIIYLLLLFFGVSAAIIPVPTFQFLIGSFYGTIWASLVAASAFVSLIGLIFRLRVEIYSGIILTTLLFVYPFYITYLVFGNPGQLDLARLGVIFAVAIYPVMPGFRVVDIVMEIRKARLRQLYALNALGEASANSNAPDN